MIAFDKENSTQNSRFDRMVKHSKILDGVFVTAIIAAGLISYNLIQAEWDDSALSVVLLFLMTLPLYWLNRKGFYKIAGTCLLIAVSGTVTYNLIIEGGLHDNAMVIFPVLITIGGLVIGKRFIPYLTGLFLLEISLIYWLTTKGLILPFGGQIEVYLHIYLTVFFLLLISGIVIWTSVETLEKNYVKIIESETMLRKSYDQTLAGWGKALELFDRETEGHSSRVSDLMLEMARGLGIQEEELEYIHWGTMLHDVGKMGVAEAILNKPGSLTKDERLEVEKHPLHAHKLLRDIPFLTQAMEIPVYHHERWDGTGYPFQLAGEEIPLSARIFALVDNWDALRSDRPYRKAWPEDEVKRYIRNQSGKKFDPDLVETFIALVE